MTQSQLSMLTGYRSKGRSVPVIEYPNTDIENTDTVVEDIENVVGTVEEESPNEVISEEEPLKEEVITDEDQTKTETEVTESEESQVEEVESELEEEEDAELDVNFEELSDEEKAIFDAVAEIYKKGGQKVIDQLSEVKGFEKFMLAIEDQFSKYHGDIKSSEEKSSEKDVIIQNLKRDQLDQKKEWELKQIEIQRYKLDDNDEYMLDLKRRLSKDTSDLTTRNKLRDEYLRGIADVDPEFDMFEYRNRVEKRRVSGIENLSGSNRANGSTASIEGEQNRQPMGLVRRSKA